VLSSIVRRALHSAPEQRYASALELREALLAVLPQLPQGALCAVQVAQSEEILTLTSDTSLQLSAAKSPFVNSLPAPAPARARGSRLLWALAGAGLLAGGALALTRLQDAPGGASLQLTAADSGSATAVAPKGAGAANAGGVPTAARLGASSTSTATTGVRPELREAIASPVAPARVKPAASAEAPAPAAVRGAPRPAASPVAKPARPRVRSARSPAAERPQKLYKKLDF
jgi:hypothetical protein